MLRALCTQRHAVVYAFLGFAACCFVFLPFFVLLSSSHRVDAAAAYSCSCPQSSTAENVEDPELQPGTAVRSLPPEEVFFMKMSNSYARFHADSLKDADAVRTARFLVFHAPRGTGGAADQIKGFTGAFAAAVCSNRVLLVDDWVLKRYYKSPLFNYDMDSVQGLRSSIETAMKSGEGHKYVAMDVWANTKHFDSENFDVEVFKGKRVVYYTSNQRTTRRFVQNPACSAAYEEVGLLAPHGVEDALVDGLLLRAILEPGVELGKAISDIRRRSGSVLYGVHVRIGMPELQDWGFVTFEEALSMLECAFARGRLLHKSFSVFLAADNKELRAEAAKRYGDQLLMHAVDHFGHVDRGQIPQDLLFSAAADLATLSQCDFLVLCASGYSAQAGWYSLSPYAFHPLTKRARPDQQGLLEEPPQLWCNAPLAPGWPLPSTELYLY